MTVQSSIAQVAVLNNLAAAGSVVVPTGAFILAIKIANTNANAVTGGLKFGSTVGATDIVAAQAVGANSLGHVTDATLLKRAFSDIATQTIFVDAVTGWNGAIVDITIVYLLLG